MILIFVVRIKYKLDDLNLEEVKVDNVVFNIIFVILGD